jgi:predicted ATP-dependent serine protease
LLSSKLIELEASCPGNYSQKPQLISLEELLAMEFPENDDLISGGIWPRETGLIVAGESGDGKSLLLNQLSICLAMGWDFLDLKVPTARRVLIFQAENTLKAEQYRFRKMLEGLGITQMPPHINFFKMQERLDLASPQDRKKMIATIQAHAAEAFFIDPLISFHNASENDNVAMRHVLDCVTEIERKTGAGAGIMHHFGKPTENGALEYRTRGAMAIRDWADTLVALTPKKALSGKILKQLTYVKVRNGYQPKPVVVERDENFLCQVIEAKSIFSPEQVQQTIRARGGRVAGWKELVAAIQDALGCSQRDAQDLIKSATENRLIKATPGEKETGKKGRAPQIYFPCDPGTD